MNGATLTGPTKTGAAIFVLAVGAFVVLYTQNLHQTMMAIPAAFGWAAALYALRPMVATEKHDSLYFAFGVMAFLIFFLHETYEFQGKLRIFPLIVGWAGVILSALDILSLTETRISRVLSLVFGSSLSEAPSEDRRAGREIACFAAMAMCVAMIWLLGFLIAGPVFVFLWMWLWGKKTLRNALYGGGFTLAFIWLLFEGLLKYELYRGVVVLWLMDNFLS
ncbi:MAG: hypothetical protein ACI82H_001611 [Alphaproteobacteria bacterium]|jgi:hypothetical protein